MAISFDDSNINRTISLFRLTNKVLFACFSFSEKLVGFMNPYISNISEILRDFSSFVMSVEILSCSRLMILRVIVLNRSPNAFCIFSVSISTFGLSSSPKYPLKRDSILESIRMNFRFGRRTSYLRMNG